MKRYMAVLGSVMFCVVCFSLYLMLETTTGASTGQNVEMGENDLSSIEAKIKRIESDLQRNHKTINLIKDTVRDIANGDTQSLTRLQKALAAQGSELFLPGELKGRAPVGSDVKHVFNVSGGHKVAVTVPKDMCSLAEKATSSAQIQMQELFKTMSFENPDGGVWKQGYPITYSESTFATTPLKVFVVPHSHNDPENTENACRCRYCMSCDGGKSFFLLGRCTVDGNVHSRYAASSDQFCCDAGWLKTFERYYTDQTRHILNNMLEKLNQHTDMKFIYAEMSFFSRWWSEISEEKRQQTRRLVKDGRLEIVTGGWVMTDEAVAHYYAMVDQLIEGNQWLLNQVGVKPSSGWAIDPFGHTPTMAYILKRSGFDNMLIQRTHYAVKKQLAQNKQLEFLWRQTWDEQGSTDMLCHMMPFYSYDVPHTCGPDPKICCQFDFKRLPGGRISCPWKISPVTISDHNVEERARMILDQWKKKSTMYQNNIVLAPLGDDFRYDKPAEWDQQYENYKKLFAYMNNRKDWNVQAQFGTLSDYFNALRERSGVTPGVLPKGYPSLSGDFFSYADRDDHYWSGYYTSRPFYKRLDRVLEYHLRAAEIAYSVALTHARKHGATTLPTSALMKQLVSARRGLGLFQHHDGITGTAKDFVVVDYGEKLLRAILDLKDVTRHAASFLLTKQKSGYTHRDSNPFLDIDEMRGSHDALPVRTVMSVTREPRPVVLYNSLGHARRTVVRLHTDTPWVELRGPDGAVVPTQVMPNWTGRETMSDRSYQVVFVASVPAIGFSRYTIQQTGKDENRLNVLTSVAFYNGGTSESVSTKTTVPVFMRTLRFTERSPRMNGPFRVDKLPHGEDFSIENSELKADFSGDNSMLSSLTLKESKSKVDVKVQFVVYGTRNHRERSGAYLFLPGAPANPLPKETALVRIHRGPIVSEVHVFIRHVQHVVGLVNSPGMDSLGVDITNLVDIRHESNYELAMRVETGIKNEDKTFYTDLNGFQMIRRQTFSKLTLQGNFYPMPTMAYLQDDKHRFSILSGQSLGAASLEQGQLEIIHDRALNQDDNRGLGQGVTDNKETPNIFRFLLESRTKPKSASPSGFLSVAATLSSRELLHPVMVMPATTAPNPPSAAELLAELAPLAADLPCELHLLNLRTLQAPETDASYAPRDDTGLLLHHTAFDCALPSRGARCPVGKGTFTFKNIFQDISVEKASSTSLTLIHDEPNLDLASVMSVPPMEIKAYKVKLG